MSFLRREQVAVGMQNFFSFCLLSLSGNDEQKALHLPVIE